jgi:predicted ATP-dependent serine protease
MTKYRCLVCGAEAELRAQFCAWCLSFDSFGIKTTRPVPATTAAAFASTADLVQRSRTPRRELPDGWEGILGSWDGSPTAVMVHGPPGAGKSTLALCGLHRVYTSGVFLAAEEGHGPALVAKLARLEMISTRVVVVASRSLEAALVAAKDVNAECVVVDSAGVVPLLEQDLAGVVEQGRSIWVICHELKDAQGYRGSAWLGHAVDIVVRVRSVDGDHIRCEVEKSRWGPLGDALIPI